MNCQNVSPAAFPTNIVMIDSGGENRKTIVSATSTDTSTGRNTLPVPSHAPPALRLGPRLDLPHPLARQPQDLPDVAQRQLVVLQHAVPQLENRLLLARPGVHRLLHQTLLLQRLQERHARRVDVR